MHTDLATKYHALEIKGTLYEVVYLKIISKRTK